MEEKSKLKISVTVEGCPYEDAETFDIFMNAQKYHSLLWDLDQNMRSRLKYEDIPDSEFDYIESLRAMIHEEGALNF